MENVPSDEYSKDTLMDWVVNRDQQVLDITTKRFLARPFTQKMTTLLKISMVVKYIMQQLSNLMTIHKEIVNAKGNKQMFCKRHVILRNESIYCV